MGANPRNAFPEGRVRGGEAIVVGSAAISSLQRGAVGSVRAAVGQTGGDQFLAGRRCALELGGGLVDVRWDVELDAVALERRVGEAREAVCAHAGGALEVIELIGAGDRVSR